MIPSNSQNNRLTRLFINNISFWDTVRSLGAFLSLKSCNHWAVTRLVKMTEGACMCKVQLRCCERRGFFIALFTITHIPTTKYSFMTIFMLVSWTLRNVNVTLRASRRVNCPVVIAWNNVGPFEQWLKINITLIFDSITFCRRICSFKF